MRKLTISSEVGRIVTAEYRRPSARRRAQVATMILDNQQKALAGAITPEEGLAVAASIAGEFTHSLMVTGITSGPAAWPAEEGGVGPADVLEDGELGLLIEAIIGTDGYAPLSQTPNAAS